MDNSSWVRNLAKIYLELEEIEQTEKGKPFDLDFKYKQNYWVSVPKVNCT
jgi:hypothetical protein